MAAPEPEPTVLLSSLNHWAYCPTRAHWIHVEGVFVENRFTLEGSDLHGSVDAPGAELRSGVRRHHAVELWSYRLGLRGKADCVEESGGRVYPVEFKRGKRGAWDNDALQLCAQAFCLEEMLGLPPIEEGALFYAASGRRKRVALDAELRGKTLRAIEAVRSMLLTRSKPPPKFGPRCRGCSLERVCLPRETELLRQRRSNPEEAEP